MKKIYLLAFTLCCTAIARSQSTVNYSFATSVTGSLTDMSTGTTTLIAADQDDVASAVTNIGFEFFFQGARYGQFSVNSNGTLRLGATAVGNTLYDPLGQTGQALIDAYGADQRTHAGDGKVHYKVTGTAPNRVLIVEWLNMQPDFNSGSTSGYTYQQRLSESTGVIEFVYGSMTMNAAGAADVNSNSPQIGFSSGNTAGTIGTVTAAQSGTPAPTYNGATATPVNNAYTAGAVTVLTSAANGSRRTFTFTPPVPTAAPTGLSFTSVVTTGMTLNWTDNASNEVGYAIYNSTDGTNYTYVTQAPQNATSVALTGLYSAINYSWRVYAVTEGGVSSALSGAQATPDAGNFTSNGTGGGPWSSPSSWANGVVPGINDSVTIRNGDVVTIDAAASAYKLVVGQGSTGVLQFEPTTARTLSVYLDVLINAGGTFQSATTGTQTGHILTLTRNLTNNGTLDFSTNANTAGANITFTSSFNTTFGGSGAVTDVRQITVNKGNSNATIVELNPSNFTVQGASTDVVVGGYLVLTNGTFKISGNFTYTGRTFSAAAYTIAATTSVWLNNPNYTIAAQNGNVINNSILRISNGTWNFGTVNTATVTAGAGAAYLIEGGTMNIAGRMTSANAISYTQTGGSVNISTVGNGGSGTGNAGFGLTSSATIFNMSGGNINLVQPSVGATPIDWYVTTANFTVTGGALQVGTAATATNFNFRLRGNVPNLLVDNTTNNKTVTFTAQANTYGTITVNPGATIVNSGQVWLMVGTPITNNGTITSTAAGSRFYFQGSAPQTYAGSGIANLLAFEVDNASGVIIDPSSTGTINTARVNIFGGGITNANKLTLGTGGASTGVIQIGVSGVTKTITGFDVSPTFNLGTGGLNLNYAPELTAHTTGPEVPAGRNISNLSVSNPNGIIISGGDLTISTGATPTLTMTTGNITTGSNTLTLGAGTTVPGTLTYTSGTIIGSFRRWIGAATGNSDFPVGIATATRNASINFTTAPTTGGTLTAQWMTRPGGSNGLPQTEGAINITGTSRDGYWSVVAGDGLTGGQYTGTFTATGIANVTDVTTLVLLKRASAGAGNPWTLDGTHVTGSGTTATPVISRTGMSGFSEFGIGSSTFAPLPVSLLTFSGERNGSVNQLRWTTANELNNAGFEVQRSTNGSEFTVLGFINAKKGTANLSYDFTDAQPAGAVQYYRLLQKDLSGEGKYSRVIAIYGEKPAVLTITSLSPNPASSTIHLLVNAPAGELASVLITDANGKTVSQHAAALQAGGSNLEIDIHTLPAGTYFMKLAGSNGTSAISRFVKQ